MGCVLLARIVKVCVDIANPGMRKGGRGAAGKHFTVKTRVRCGNRPPVRHVGVQHIMTPAQGYSAFPNSKYIDLLVGGTDQHSSCPARASVLALVTATTTVRATMPCAVVAVSALR